MQREGIRVKDVNGLQFDAKFGIFTAAAPIMVYNPTTGLFEGSAQGIPGTFAADDEPRWNGTLWVPKLEKTLAVNPDFTGAGASLTDITGLVVSLPRAGTYWCEFSLATALATSSQAIAAGINVTANFTRCAIQVNNFTTATAVTAGCQVANNTATSSAARVTLAANLPVTLSGSVTVSGACTLSCRIQRAANVLTVVAGSSGFVMEL